MGAVYDTSVKIKVRVGKEREMLESVKSYLKTRFIAEECLKRLLGANTTEDMIKLLYCGYPMEQCDCQFSNNEGVIELNAAFNASYGWAGVMEEAGEIIKIYCEPKFRKVKYHCW